MAKDWFKDLYTLLTSTVVYRIITITVLIYFVQLVGLPGALLTYWGALIPDQLLQGQVWRLFSYGFLHDQSLFHVAFNMLGLWFFGRELEQFWGGRKFFLFYIFGIFFSGLFGLLNLLWGQGYVPIIGASGAVYGVLLIYAILFPERELLLYFVIRIPVRVAVFLLTLLSIAGFLGKSDGVAHLVHLGGFVAGWLFFKYADTFSAFTGNMFHSRTDRSAKLFTFEKKEEPTVDDILRKINKTGMKSLTQKELHILKEYSSRK